MAIETSVKSGGIVRLPSRVEASLPALPRTVEETGLDYLFLVELVAKVLFVRGQVSLAELSAHLRLPATVLETLLAFMRTERLCEVVRRGGAEGDVNYQLTDAGRQRAIGYLARSQYAGVAPVSLRAYYDAVEAQSVAGLRVTREDVKRVFEKVVVKPVVIDQVGAAMNSGRAIFLYGPAGSGKTYLAERLRGLLQGSIVVPHAIAVGNEVIQMYDPLVHRRVESKAAPAGGIDRATTGDTRWELCERPVVLSGGELKLEMLDLDYDEATRFYQAPPHLKANNGIYVVDDLGRQLVTPRDLMNRWVVPLDRRKDYLSLRTGHKFAVPFDVVVVFSTNLKPADLVDEAFLRRLGYKIYLGPMSEDEYRTIFRDVCTELGIGYTEEMFQYLLHSHHDRENKPRLACYPRDILSQLRDFAIYEGGAPELSAANLDRAWHNYFISE
jgi:energy-coupling factor transporter ATP-binding protein EcfA2